MTLDDAYEAYFGKTKPTKEEAVKPSIETGKVGGDYTYEQFVPKQNVKVNTTADMPEASRIRYVAENNIDDIDKLGEILRTILNTAWGSDWGDITPELKHGENPNDVRLPQITFDINSREVADGTAIKPILMDTIEEVVNGKKTGDAFNIYRQWFDCVVEFDFWGRNSLESRQLMNNFEALMGAYAGYLKRQGISEIFFLKEISPRQSVKYVEGIPMRCLMYYVRLERIQSVRISVLKKIMYELSANDAVDQSITFTTEQDSSDDIYSQNGNVYNL